MSASNASAKKRRAIIPPNSAESFPNVGGRPYIPPKSQIPPASSVPVSYNPNQGASNVNTPPPTQAGGFTLPQVIALIDKRLVNLEKSVTEINKKQSAVEVSSNQVPYGGEVVTPSQLNEIQEHVSEQTVFNKQTQDNFQTVNDNLNEYDTRFEIIVNEIAELKFIVLKLQTYTMDVNKMLLEERQGSIGTTATERSVPSLSDMNDGFADDDLIHTTDLYASPKGEEGVISNNGEMKYTLSDSVIDENGNLATQE